MVKIIQSCLKILPEAIMVSRKRPVRTLRVLRQSVHPTFQHDDRGLSTTTITIRSHESVDTKHRASKLSLSKSYKYPFSSDSKFIIITAQSQLPTNTSNTQFQLQLQLQSQASSFKLQISKCFPRPSSPQPSPPSSPPRPSAPLSLPLPLPALFSLPQTQVCTHSQYYLQTESLTQTDTHKQTQPATAPTTASTATVKAARSTATATSLTESASTLARAAVSCALHRSMMILIERSIDETSWEGYEEKAWQNGYTVLLESIAHHIRFL